MVPVSASVACRLDEPFEAGGVRVARFRPERVARDAVEAEPPARDFFLEVTERNCYPAIELVTGFGERNALRLRVVEEILRIVQQADVERLDAEPLEGTLELIFEPLGVNAVPEAVSDFHHLGERRPGLVVALRELQIFAL